MQINLSTRQSRAFITLVGEKNFTWGGSSKSSVSTGVQRALVRQLKKSIGSRLFERTTRWSNSRPGVGGVGVRSCLLPTLHLT
jgi:hypothetical protein